MVKNKYPQNEYNKRWEEKNKKRRTYLSLRGSARTFIRKHATSEDLDELEKLIKEKREINKNIRE